MAINFRAIIPFSYNGTAYTAEQTVDVSPLTDDQLAQLVGRGYVAAVFGGGAGGTTTDHGDLLGLADDDHAAYLNVTRGDIRYHPRSDVIALVNARYLLPVDGIPEADLEQAVRDKLNGGATSGGDPSSSDYTVL